MRKIRRWAARIDLDCSNPSDRSLNFKKSSVKRLAYPSFNVDTISQNKVYGIAKEQDSVAGFKTAVGIIEEIFAGVQAEKC